ncbi:class I SAM-dependent methyltransferase [Nocardia aobensis]|uniref:class I SAM-dependent methyltransferase n=1 Tax=Nocardia aobensis TaxID=257277 RepID=UPI000A044681|nr:class I SAM-dependent methyltransferase [Nocardia aobensis]
MSTPEFDRTTYFNSVYSSQSPDGAAIRAAGWDIGMPQPEVLALEEAGAIGHRVLDAGCGSGENALYLASRGHEVTGVDIAPAALEHARFKASRRGVDATFVVGDGRELPSIVGQFDAIVDSGLFHIFTLDDRSRYVEALRGVSVIGGVVHILAVSDLATPGPGPQRLTEHELRDAFGNGWAVDSLRRCEMLGRLPGDDLESAVPAWLLSARRTL